MGRNLGKGDIAADQEADGRLKKKRQKNQDWQETQFFKTFGCREVRKVGQCLAVCLLKGEIFISVLKAWIYLNTDGEGSR